MNTIQSLERIASKITANKGSKSNESLVADLLHLVDKFVRGLDPTQLAKACGAQRSLVISHLQTVIEWTCQHVSADASIDILSCAAAKFPVYTLTPFHPYLQRQCCKTRRYEDAISKFSLDRIQHLHASLKYQDVLVYHFFLALSHTAMASYETALELFCTVFTAPGRRTSMIQLEALRKYYLVSLIHCSQVVPWPHSVNDTSAQLLFSLTVPYKALESILTQPIRVTRETIEIYTKEYEQDGNMPLIRSILATLLKHKIQKLGKVYTSLSIADTAAKTEADSEGQVYEAIAAMTASKTFNVQVENDIVFFPKTAPLLDAQVAWLAERVSQVAAINQQLFDTQKSVEAEKSHHKGNKSNPANPGMSSGGSMSRPIPIPNPGSTGSSAQHTKLESPASFTQDMQDMENEFAGGL